MFSTSKAVFQSSLETLTLTETIVNKMGDPQVLQKEDSGQNGNNQNNEDNDPNEYPSNSTVNDGNVSLQEDHENEACKGKETFKCIKEKGVNVLDIIVRYIWP